MFSHKRVAFSTAVIAALAACATQQQSDSGVPPERPNLGLAATPEQIKAWDISIPPSGEGLPPGSGTVKQGAAVYAAKCQACHGEKGIGKPADPLVGGTGSLPKPNAVRTVGSYWPYATTLFDYVRRAMPTTAPMTLTNDEVYAVAAYILNLNGIVDGNVTMTAQTLPAVRMPNRDGFVSDWPPSKR
jgi:S-disulfanyl-L-cysteine oxidoreductase SoxD